jgi:hypothetical protein
VSRARSQAASEASGPQVQQDEFNEENFHRGLLTFIVANDQVRDLWSFYIHYAQLIPNCKSLNVVECPEFRRLILLLRSDLNDSQVPRRTKMRELVLRAWSQYFQVLRRDLAVCLPLFFFDD